MKMAFGERATITDKDKGRSENIRLDDFSLKVFSLLSTKKSMRSESNKC